MAFNSQIYLEALGIITGDTMGSAFVREDVQHNDAVGRAARVQDNDELLGLQGGSIESVLRRTESLARHNQELFKRAAEGGRKDDTATLLAMLDNQLADLEDRIAGQYGENFAEDLLSELREEGHVDQDEYDRIMAIEDQDERRRAIAELIQQKINDGSLTYNDLKDSPWAREWLNSNKAVQLAIEAKADDVIAGRETLQGQDYRVRDEVEVKLAENGENVEQSSEDIEKQEVAQNNTFTFPA